MLQFSLQLFGNGLLRLQCFLVIDLAVFRCVALGTIVVVLSACLAGVGERCGRAVVTRARQRRRRERLWGQLIGTTRRAWMHYVINEAKRRWRVNRWARILYVLVRLAALEAIDEARGMGEARLGRRRLTETPLSALQLAVAGRQREGRQNMYRFFHGAWGSDEDVIITLWGP